MTTPVLLGVQQTAKVLGVHANTVRNMAGDGRIRPAARVGPRGFLRFAPDEVERVRRQMTGLDRAGAVPPPGTVIGLLVRLTLLPGMTPEQAVAEAARGIRFGRPEVRLHYVLPPAPEQEES